MGMQETRLRLHFVTNSGLLVASLLLAAAAGDEVVGSPTNDTLVGFGKGSGVGNENQEGWSSSQEEDQGLEFEE